MFLERIMVNHILNVGWKFVPKVRGITDKIARHILKN